MARRTLSLESFTVKKLLLIAVLLAGACVVGTAQTAGESKPRNNLLTFGVGGGGIIGVSYDRVLLTMPRMSLNANVGAGYLIFGAGFPHGLTVTFGGTHSLELGLVGTFLVVKPFSLGIFGPADDALEMAYRVSPLVGYRRQRPDGGLVIRLSFSPFMHNDSTLVDNDNAADFTFVPWGSLMFGFAF